MAPLVYERSKITAKGQTTVPKAVRQALSTRVAGSAWWRRRRRRTPLSTAS